jgi:lipopolysaccharide export system protein LptA
VRIGHPAGTVPSWCIALLVLLSPCTVAPLFAQGLGLTSSTDKRPLDVQAEQGIEWQQDRKVYIARGNARASRGNATLYADTLIAHYRTVAPDPAKPVASPPAASPPADGQPAAPGSSTSSTEIYRIEAEGNVRLQTDTQTVFGDHGIYDIDSATAVITGKHLKLVTPRDTVTARDSLEWHDSTLLAVARGDAVSVRDAKRLAGDVLVAQVVKPANGPSRISRIDAQGHVVVTTPNEIARGTTGVYNVDTGIVTLTGGVTLTRGDNELRGEYGVVDVNSNISRLLSVPPGDSTEHVRVQALIIPRSSAKPAPGDATARVPVPVPVPAR